MFKLYTDKNNTFKCKVIVEGASEYKSKARLVIEGDTHNLMFEGTLENGICEVEIGKFKNFDGFKSKGNLRLEVIADDTYFVPWESEYKIEQSKSVVIEMVEDKKPLSKPVVKVKTLSYTNDNPKVEIDKNGDAVYKLLVKENINVKKYSSLNDMLRSNNKAKQVLKDYIAKYQLSESKVESTLRYLVDKF